MATPRDNHDNVSEFVKKFREAMDEFQAGMESLNSGFAALLKDLSDDDD